MQLIDIATTSIALFGAAYFLIALAAHLHHCWQYPPVKAAPIVTVEGFNLLEVIDPCDLLLLLLPPAAELHPFELSLEKMPALETIAAVHQPAASVEPSIEPDAPIDYQAMSSQQLRTICTQHGIQWRSVNAGKHLSKPEMIAALS